MIKKSMLRRTKATSKVIFGMKITLNSLGLFWTLIFVYYDYYLFLPFNSRKIILKIFSISLFQIKFFLFICNVMWNWSHHHWFFPCHLCFGLWWNCTFAFNFISHFVYCHWKIILMLWRRFIDIYVMNSMLTKNNLNVGLQFSMAGCKTRTKRESTKMLYLILFFAARGSCFAPPPYLRKLPDIKKQCSQVNWWRPNLFFYWSTGSLVSSICLNLF